MGMKWVYDKELEKVIDYDLWCERQAAKRANKAHFVIGDEMDPTRHPSNGKIYTSKSKFRDETRARGLFEVGNDWRNEEHFTPEVRTGTCKETLSRVMRGDLPAVTPVEAAEILSRQH